MTNYITSRCVISNNVVYNNGTDVFKHKGVNANDFLIMAYQFTEIKYPKFYKMDNLSKLGWLASEILLSDYKSENYRDTDAGIVLTNANASLDTDIKYYDGLETVASPALFVYTLPNIVIGEISIRNKFKGENGFFVFELFNADFLWQYVNYLLDNDILQVCLCGWVDYLNEDYKAVLYLVEKSEKEGGSIPFTIENIDQVYMLNK